jgi:hypothetical protein
MTTVTDTHRRAALRGREAVAKGRITSGVWAGRLFTIIFAVAYIAPVLQRGKPWLAATSILAAMAAGIFFATERMRRGSRLAACILLGLFGGAKLLSWLAGGQPLWSGALWTVLIFSALANGVWGTFALAAVRRDAAHVPPAPPRPGAERPPPNVP